MDGDLPLYTMPWKQDGENVTEELRISVNSYKGTKYFAVRVWFQGRNNVWLPGKNGVNVPLDKVEEFVTLIDKGFTRLQSLAKHGHVDLPKRSREPSPRLHQGSRKVPKRPETREEEQLQQESDERARLNDRIDDARD